MYNLAKHFKKIGKDLNYADSILIVDNFLPVFEMSNQLKIL
jgi:hypothetical protein